MDSEFLIKLNYIFRLLLSLLYPNETRLGELRQMTVDSRKINRILINVFTNETPWLDV